MAGPRRGTVRALAAGVALALLPGCLTAHAALQAGQGQFGLLLAKRPIAQVIEDPRTPPRLRALLGQIPRIKAFGEENGLTPTANYTQYVKLRRRAVVWVVSACEPLRFHSKTWSFPVAGDFPYLGWFDPRSAQDQAKDLAGEGWDVDLRPASAYSTLGYFEDPVLSSMIAPGPEALGDLADVVLHESVHATLHLDGQAIFNESLAQFLGDELARRWLDRARGPLSRERTAWERQQQRGALTERELHLAYEELDALYRSARSDDEKRARKAEVLARLTGKLDTRRRPITNATLLQHRAYRSGIAGFTTLLAACNGDVRCFLSRLRTLDAHSFAEPHQEELDPLLERLAH